jgi:hypothetical protein
MKTIITICAVSSLVCLTYSCKTDNNNSTGNGAVMEESNKDDYYQMRGYGDSIPSDSIKEQVRLDSIRIAKSNHHNK